MFYRYERLVKSLPIVVIMILAFLLAISSNNWIVWIQFSVILTLAMYGLFVILFRCTNLAELRELITVLYLRNKLLKYDVDICTKTYTVNSEIYNENSFSIIHKKSRLALYSGKIPDSISKIKGLFINIDLNTLNSRYELANKLSEGGVKADTYISSIRIVDHEITLNKYFLFYSTVLLNILLANIDELKSEDITVYYLNKLDIEYLTVKGVEYAVYQFDDLVVSYPPSKVAVSKYKLIHG